MILAGCSCRPAVDGVLATDTLAPAPVNVRAFLLSVPASGDLNVTFAREDGREEYSGSVYLFVTAPDCNAVTENPSSLRDGQRFTPMCSVLANSYKDLNCCLGRVTLASPARVRRGMTVKIFVYGLNQPASLPYVLTFEAGGRDCRSPRVVSISKEEKHARSKAHLSSTHHHET
jgi:hypothetical protein